MAITNYESLSRYHRQMALPGIGASGQTKLLGSRVLVVGAGGLGSPTLMYLAAAGVGSLGIVDNDVVEVSNLQRQIIHTTGDCGKPKVESARRALKALNPAVEVHVHNTKLSFDNVEEIIAHYDIVIDCTDNFPTRILLGDACYLSETPLIWGSIYQYSGQVSVFLNQETPCHRCLYGDPPPQELAPSCAEGGVLGAICASVASVQSTEAIKLILQIGRPLAGLIWTHDGLTANTQLLELAKDPECDLCGLKASIQSIQPPVSAQPQDRGVPAVGPDQLRSLLKDRKEGRVTFDLIDVREVWEREMHRIEGSEHIALNDFMETLPSHSESDRIILYCETGRRSSVAGMAALEAGIAVEHLEGGMRAWNN